MELEFQGTLSLGTEIRTGGFLVLGNEQDEAGGGFDPEQSFNGTLDEMLLFDNVFDENDIADLFESVLEPPKITEKEPEDGTWPVTTVINITFNVEMDQGSFPDGFSIEPAVVTGPATDNAVGVDQIVERLSVPAINALSNGVALGDLVAGLLDDEVAA